jgi:hypothetical protein
VSRVFAPGVEVSAMLALTLVVVGALTLLLSVAGVCARGRNRRGGDPLVRRARALDMLRDIAEHPHPIESHTAPPDPDPSGAVHVLDTAHLPDNVRALPYRRKAPPPRRHVIQRPHPDEVALRPTVAQLPRNAKPLPTRQGGDDTARNAFGEN